MMRTAGARIMSISGAWRAQTSPGLPADAHDAGFWGAKMGGTTVHELALPAPGAALKLAGEWLRNAHAFRVAFGACFWTARCSASNFDDAASARGRDLVMRTAGARIMSISGARRAHLSPGLPADAHDAGFWGAKMGGTTARCTNSRCP